MVTVGVRKLEENVKKKSFVNVYQDSQELTVVEVGYE